MVIIESEFKKMPAQKQINLVNRLLKTLDRTIIEDHKKTEEDLILEQRLKKLNSGKMNFDSWENAKKRLLNKAALRNKK